MTGASSFHDRSPNAAPDRERHRDARERSGRTARRRSLEEPATSPRGDAARGLPRVPVGRRLLSGDRRQRGRHGRRPAVVHRVHARLCGRHRHDRRGGGRRSAADGPMSDISCPFPSPRTRRPSHERRAGSYLSSACGSSTLSLRAAKAARHRRPAEANARRDPPRRQAKRLQPKRLLDHSRLNSSHFGLSMLVPMDRRKARCAIARQCRKPGTVPIACLRNR